MKATSAVSRMGSDLGEGPHDALDALSTAIKIRKVNWIASRRHPKTSLGAVSQNWLVRFLEHRIGDKRIIRMIQKVAQGRHPSKMGS